MMNNKKKQTKMMAIALKIASIMLVLGMLASAVAMAETPRDRYQDAQDNYQSIRDRLSDTQQIYQDSKDRFQDARDRFEAERNPENSDDLKEALREYLTRVIEYTIERLETLMARAEVAEENGNAPFEFSDNIETYIADLEDLKADVDAAETREDFQAVIREIRDIWQHVHLESKYFIMGTVHTKLGVFLEKGESIIPRIEAEIERQAALGVDTSEAEELLDEYQDALDEAQELYDEVQDLMDEHEGFDDHGVLQDPEDARNFLKETADKMRETHQAMKEAQSILRQIFIELKEHRPGSVHLRGTRTLTAEGDGMAALTGDLEVEVSATHGVLIIKDHDGDAEYEVEGTQEVLDDGTVRYEGFDGTATISGSSITVTVKGEDIVLSAEGTGSARLRGHGTYTAEGEEDAVVNEWAPNGGEMS